MPDQAPARLAKLAVRSLKFNVYRDPIFSKTRTTPV